MATDRSIDWLALRAAAAKAASCAYAPYSRLSVGVAGLVDDDRLITGCNVENASYGLTLCAECGLVSDFHRTGATTLIAVSIVDGHGRFLWPCGRCRQLLFEVSGADLLIDAADGPIRLAALLPFAFGPEHLPTD